MGMDKNSTRVFVYTFAHRAVNDVKKDGFRQLRNYVDMCAMLANKEMHKAFFGRAQNLLQKADSLYYSLVQRMVNTVDEDRLCTVGVNLGFNGMVYGAGQLKQRAEQTGEPVFPISVAMADDPELDQEVSLAEKGGSYIWVLHSEKGLTNDTIVLAKKHPQSVFFPVLDPASLDAVAVAALASCNNIVSLLTLEQPELSEAAHNVVRLFQHERLFFGFTVCLDEDMVEQATQNMWLQVLARESLFCIYSRKEGMDAKISEQLKQAIYRSRTSSGVPVLLLDWENDCRVLNEYIAPTAAIGGRMPEKACVGLHP